MISVRNYKPGDVFSVHLKDAFYAEAEVKSAIDKSSYEDSFHGHTLLEGDKIVGCIGLNILWPGVAEGWAALSEDVKGAPLSFHRAVKRGIEGYAKELKLHRIHVTVLETFKDGNRWVELLGFKNEGHLRKFGPFKDNFYLWAWVN